MKKVGIITIMDNNNYGNRLQNYAVQEVLRKNKLDVYTLKNDACINTKKFFLLRFLKNIFNSGSYSDNDARKKNFEKFNENLIYGKESVNAFSKKCKYDYVIVGSDQVWNPNFGRLRDVDVLSFVEPNKRISFSASFGVDNLSESEKRLVKKEIIKFKSISVREDIGKKIIEEITNRKDVDVLVDPTMLLSCHEWDKILKKPIQINNESEKYILNYFLGNLSLERRHQIEIIAKENNCKIINILDKNDPFYVCGPSEFLWLEKHAFLICTDSFHSSVFAVLYNRPFVVFNREDKNESMNSRIQTLLLKFDLKNREYNGKNITNENINHNYNHAFKILEKERLKSELFLKNALDLEENE